MMQSKSTVLFDSYQVPFTQTQNDDYSFEDFSLRHPEDAGKAYKYSYLPNKLDSLIPHRTYSPLLGRYLRRSLAPKVPISDAYFLHYMGITTSWKSAHWNRLNLTKDTSGLVEDRSVSDYFNGKNS
jgi:hypothetical protein